MNDADSYCETIELMFSHALKGSKNMADVYKHYPNVWLMKKFFNELYDYISSEPVSQPAQKASAPIADPGKATGYEEAINEFFAHHGDSPMDIETIETTLDSLLVNALESQDNGGAGISSDFAILVNGLRRLIRTLGACKN